MQFGEMTELIVLQTFGQSLRNMNSFKSDVLSNLILVGNWLPLLPMTRHNRGRLWGSDGVCTKAQYFCSSPAPVGAFSLISDDSAAPFGFNSNFPAGLDSYRAD